MIVSKSYEDTRKHFIDRFKERHGEDLTEKEYDELSLLANVLNKFEGIHQTNSSKTVGKLPIRDKKYWVLYDNKEKYFCTVYPDIDNNIEGMAMAFFGKKGYRLVLKFHDYIEETCDKERTDFDSLREASIYYYQYAEFPKVMVRRFLHGRDISEPHLIYQFKFIDNLLKERQVPGFKMKFIIERTDKGEFKKKNKFVSPIHQ